jgi:hypothetical protein
MRILRGLTSRLLPCGCIAGVYETYQGRVITLLDDRHASCTEPSHVAGEEIPELASIGPTSEVGLHTDRQSKP